MDFTTSPEGQGASFSSDSFAQMMTQMQQQLSQQQFNQGQQERNTAAVTFHQGVGGFRYRRVGGDK